MTPGQLEAFNLMRLQDELVAAAIPAIAIVSEGGIQISYEPEATAQQIIDGDAILAAFDFSEAATEAWIEDKKPDRKSIRERLQDAIAEIDWFLALENPTANQAVAAVQRLARNQKHILRHIAQSE